MFEITYTISRFEYFCNSFYLTIKGEFKCDFHFNQFLWSFCEKEWSRILIKYRLKSFLRIFNTQPNHFCYEHFSWKKSIAVRCESSPTSFHFAWNVLRTIELWSVERLCKNISMFYSFLWAHALTTRRKRNHTQ